MKRSVVIVWIALVTAVLPLSSAHAQAPTPEQLEAAKKAFAEGKSLYDAKKLPEAVEKFKESYRLSKNPLLLYNIGLTLDEAGQKDKALFYYRKFLSDAPADAAQRQTVTDRVKLIEQEQMDADLNAPVGPKVDPNKVEHDPSKIKVKPAGTYGPNDFQHQVVEEAPPGKPLDLTASVPEDSGFVVTLFYRGSGDASFTAKPMKWRYRELVARIPAAKVGGSSIQYYIEVKDAAGTVITKSGKSTSPNLVNVEAGATPRFYPDLTDEGTQVSSTVTKRHDEEDPLHPNNNNVQEKDPDIVERPVVPAGPADGFMDVGSKKFRNVKWTATITVGAAALGAVAFGVLASKQASALADDAHNCPGNGQPPCRMFDDYDQDLQSAGKRYQTLTNVSIGVGVVAAAVAGYYWFKEMRSKKSMEVNATAKPKDPELTWTITPLAPAFGDGFTGAAAAARF